MRFGIVGLAFVVGLGLGLGCKPEPAGFGEKEKTKDDGKVREAPDLPKAPDFKNAMKLAADHSAADGKLTVTLHLAEGYHAYAPGEKVGKPVQMSIQNSDGWTVEGAPVIPAGVEKDLGELGKSQVLEGKVSLTAVVKGGQGPIKGTVKVQICTDTACDRPKSVPFEAKPAS
jgi:hypothetical protein